MDEDERKEEEYNTYVRPRRQRIKMIRRQYLLQIRDHLNRRDFKSAFEAFAEMKQKHIFPNVHMYNIFLFAFAQQGDVKMCFKLYNELKKRGLQPKPATYTSLINACAECRNSKNAMEYLYKLRTHLLKNNYEFNVTHYHAMIKAYSHHECITDALQVADEMKDKGIFFTSRTYSVLLHCAMGDKDNGLRYALGIWHQMRKEGILPNVNVYNSLLMAIRDANLSNLDVNQSLIPGESNITIISNSNETTPDLLASPPIINPSLLSKIQNISENQPELSEKYIPQNRILTHSTEDTLSEIISRNRLILFGGAQSILKKMENDNAKPNEITLTLLVLLVAPTLGAENEIINYAKKNHIKLDKIFYNILIKKRVNRNDYENAKAVLNLMQLDDLQPDVVTFGTLAVGCKTFKEYDEFITGMETMGLIPNKIILSTFIYNACRRRDFPSLKMLIDYILDNRIKPEQTIFDILDHFMNLLEKKRITTCRKDYQQKFEKFLTAYKQLKKTQEPAIISTEPHSTVENSARA